MRAGVGRACITPPVGVAMGGFAARKKPSIGVHDDLWAKALILEDKGTKAAIITCDILGLGKPIVDKTKSLIEQETGIRKENIIVCFSHTHSGPVAGPVEAPPRWWDKQGREGVEQRWTEVLPDLIAGAVFSANSSLEEVAVGTNSGQCKVGINRRKRGQRGFELAPNPSGPVDPEVGVLRVDRVGGSPMAILVNYACHAVTLGADNLFISADYPGYMTRALEKTLDDKVTVMFANGTAGNINPRFRGNFKAAERAGLTLAGEALKRVQKTEVLPDVNLRIAQKKIYLPLKDLPPLEEAKRLAEEKEKIFKKGEKQEKAWVEMVTAYHTVDILEELFGSQKKSELKKGRMLSEIQVLLLGENAFVALPGEIFTEIGLNIKEKSPFAKTFVFGYSNDYSVSYVPTSQAYQLGGYEPRWARVSPGADEVIQTQSLQLLKKLK